MKTALFALCLMLSGAALAGEQTVAGNESISRVVADNLSPKLAKLILETPYDGFYAINGKMRRGGEYRFNRIRDKNSYPDDRWEALAKDVAKRINFEGDANMVGSRTKPGATAYVVMFKDGIQGIKHTGEGESLALVMIDQQNAANPNLPSVKASGQSLFLMDLSMN